MRTWIDKASPADSRNFKSITMHLFCQHLLVLSLQRSGPQYQNRQSARCYRLLSADALDLQVPFLHSAKMTPSTVRCQVALSKICLLLSRSRHLQATRLTLVEKISSTTQTRESNKKCIRGSTRFWMKKKPPKEFALIR